MNHTLNSSIRAGFRAILMLLLFIPAAFTQHSHELSNDSNLASHTHDQPTQADATDELPESTESASESNRKVTAELADFPSLHPLIVHFAIVLLIVGAGLQGLNVVLLKKEIAWIAFGITGAGAISAYLAGSYFHPHTHGLTDHAQLVLDQHDYWADWTLYLGIAGVVLQALNLFFLAGKRWAVAAIAVVLLGAGFAVARTGHYGAQLVHIEGVGPQGNFLEVEGHEHVH